MDTSSVPTDKIDLSNTLTQDLQDLKAKEEDIEKQISRKEDKIAAREKELEDKQSAEYDSVAELTSDIEDLEQQIETKQEQLDRLEGHKASITPLKRAVKQLADNSITAKQIDQIAEQYGHSVFQHTAEAGSDGITDVLVDSETTSCLLCGNEVEDGHYSDVQDRLNDLSATISTKQSDVQAEIDSLRNEKSDLESQIADIQSAESRIQTLESEIETLQEEIETATDDLEEVRQQQQSVESDIEDLEQDTIKEAQSKMADIRQLESEKGDLERNIQSVEETIQSHRESIEQLEADIESLEAEISTKDEINAQLDRLRGRVDEIERSVVSEFNDQMDDIVDKLRYSNIERIWIEKKTQTVKQGRRKVDQTVFDLHVVREINGTAVEDTVANLSESEREVTSILLAVTGYLVHDVADVFPIMLFDSIEMIDADRIDELMRYIESNVTYLILAALPEDTEAMSFNQVLSSKERST
jgi:DNA repair exonuclease SbcCD ATPase subunit